MMETSFIILSLFYSVVFGFPFPPTELFNDSPLFGGHTIMESSLALNSPPGGKPISQFTLTMIN